MANRTKREVPKLSIEGSCVMFGAVTQKEAQHILSYVIRMIGNGHLNLIEREDKYGICCQQALKKRSLKQRDPNIQKMIQRCSSLANLDEEFLKNVKFAVRQYFLS